MSTVIYPKGDIRPIMGFTFFILVFSIPEVSQPWRWMFNVIGMGIKIPRPLQGINYVELRIIYDISVIFYFSNNGSANKTIGNTYYANIFHPRSGAGTYELEVGQFDA